MTWHTVPLRYLTLANTSTLPESTSADLSFKYVDISAVHEGGYIQIPEEETTFADAPSRARRLASPGAVIISTVRTYLRAVAQVPTDSHGLVFSTGFAVLEPTSRVDSRYLGYACQSDSFVSDVVARSTGVNYPAINTSELVAISIPLPPLEEQRRIADFLDDQTTRIDQAIQLRQRQRSTAVERLESLLGEATLGSGRSNGRKSRWHGTVSLAAGEAVERSPEEWRRVRLKAVAQRSYRVRGLQEVPLLSLSSIGALLPRRDDQQPPADESLPRYLLVEQGDLVVNPMWLTGGAIAVSQAFGAVSPDYRVFRLDESVHPEFLHHLLRSRPYFDQYRLYTRADTTFDRRVQQGDLDNLPLALPELREQVQIAASLNESASATRRVVSLLDGGVSLLQERKRSLITAAVTGEFDVSTVRRRFDEVPTTTGEFHA